MHLVTPAAKKIHGLLAGGILQLAGGILQGEPTGRIHIKSHQVGGLGVDGAFGGGAVPAPNLQRAEIIPEFHPFPAADGGIGVIGSVV
ncbi:hypothetical protein D3C81_1708620 [compost metagenome]